MLSKRFSILIIFILVFLSGNVQRLYLVIVSCYSMCNGAILAINDGLLRFKKNIFT
jgi:hypothetical protein